MGIFSTSVFNKSFALAGLALGVVASSASTANAFCRVQGQPQVSLSIRNEGRDAGFVIRNARISASFSNATYTSDSDSSCGNSTTTQIYVDNRYIGGSDVNWDSRTVGDGQHRVEARVSDNSNNSSSTSVLINVRNNYVRSEVFDISIYLGLNPDVYNASQGDTGRALTHWLTFGIREGRRASLAFSAKEYLEINGDVANAFGSTNYSQAIDHYIMFGLNERRAGVQALRGEVFNAQNYLDRHGDLQAAFGPNNIEAAKQHWVQYGIREGHQANDSFNSQTYLNRYGDLQNAYGGNNYEAATYHYLRYGLSEGRSGI